MQKLFPDKHHPAIPVTSYRVDDLLCHRTVTSVRPDLEEGLDIV